ncbi:unnamed protein product, partial [Discosporangium mesarthrocarpum]
QVSVFRPHLSLAGHFWLETMEESKPEVGVERKEIEQGERKDGATSGGILSLEVENVVDNGGAHELKQHEPQSATQAQSQSNPHLSQPVKRGRGRPRIASPSTAARGGAGSRGTNKSSRPRKQKGTVVNGGSASRSTKRPKRPVRQPRLKAVKTDPEAPPSRRAAIQGTGWELPDPKLCGSSAGAATASSSNDTSSLLGLDAAEEEPVVDSQVAPDSEGTGQPHKRSLNSGGEGGLWSGPGRGHWDRQGKRGRAIAGWLTPTSADTEHGATVTGEFGSGRAKSGGSWVDGAGKLLEKRKRKGDGSGLSMGIDGSGWDTEGSSEGMEVFSDVFDVEDDLLQEENTDGAVEEAGEAKDQIIWGTGNENERGSRGSSKVVVARKKRPRFDRVGVENNNKHGTEGVFSQTVGQKNATGKAWT